MWFGEILNYNMMLTSLTVLVCCLGNPVIIKGTYYGDHLFDLYLWHLSSYMNNGKTRIEFHESIHKSIMETQHSLMVLRELAMEIHRSNIGLQNACRIMELHKK